MNKENKLGMGLGALLSNSTNEISKGVKKINISQIQPNPSQPRKNFKEEDLIELASSIKAQGLIQPIIVRKKHDDLFQIIAGERRWRASQLAGLHEIDCVIKDMEDTQVLEAALIENIQREDLNVIEEANAYKGLLQLKNITNENLAKILGKSSSHVLSLTVCKILTLTCWCLRPSITGPLRRSKSAFFSTMPRTLTKYPFDTLCRGCIS